MSMIEAPEQEETTVKMEDPKQTDAYRRAMRKEEIVQSRLTNPTASKLVGAASLAAAILLIGYTTELPFVSGVVNFFESDSSTKQPSPTPSLPAAPSETGPEQPLPSPQIGPSIEKTAQDIVTKALDTASAAMQVTGETTEALPSFANLSLNKADFNGKDLRGIQFNNSQLKEADFEDADLRAVDFSNADLSGADLEDADLRLANLSNANLSGAKLKDADLRGAILSNANLRNADLNDTDLRGAVLKNTILDGANIDDAKLR